MAIDIKTLKDRYIDSCKACETIPNKAVLSALFKAEVKKSNNEESTFLIYLDDFKSIDFHPLYNLFLQIDLSEIDSVDILQKSSCSLDGDSVLLLLHAINQKLRVVDLQDRTFGKDFLMGLSLGGMSCQILNLKFSHFRKINMIGKFIQIRTLNLDFSASLTNFGKDCFSCMPNLKSLSLCETKVSNLWTTSASLAKLPSLIELRFQSCLCCDDTRVCPRSFGVKADENTSPSSSSSSILDRGFEKITPFLTTEENTSLFSNMEDELYNVFPVGSYNNTVHETVSESDESTDSEVDFSNTHPGIKLLEDFTYGPGVWNGLLDLPNEISPGTWGLEDTEESFPTSSTSKPISVPRKKHLSYHPSPICYEKHYREYLITSFPNLKVLDNIPIKKPEKEKASITYSQNFESLPYKRTKTQNVLTILQNREIKAKGISGKSQYSYPRSINACKVGCVVLPSLHPLSVSCGSMQRGDGRKFRPRQFEYHPNNPSLMVIGTLDGEVVVVNHESEKIVRYIPSHGEMNSVLGLCWLKKYPSKLISGSDNGLLKLYDIQHIHSDSGFHQTTPASNSFDEFDQLTSVHVNSTDELFLASGYSKHVALYDIHTAKRLQVFTDMHQEHINVVKFANHSPSMFATSSFDHDVKMWDLRQKPVHPCYTASSSRGNVMVCFSHDDHYLLASAVDNEVKQLLAVDGRLHLDFGIAATGSSQNYTRSYYMNGRDYILSGSCDEHVVRICCAQTGRRLRDISLEGKSSGSSMFVQSLRGDPFRDFNLSVLAAYLSPSSSPEIVKVNMLTSKDADKELGGDERARVGHGMGGG